MLAYLGGGPVDSRGQREFDQTAITTVLADVRVLHLDAQTVRPRVGMVGVEISLQGLVGPDTADVRLG